MMSETNEKKGTTSSGTKNHQLNATLRLLMTAMNGLVDQRKKNKAMNDALAEEVKFMFIHYQEPLSRRTGVILPKLMVNLFSCSLFVITKIRTG